MGTSDLVETWLAAARAAFPDIEVADDVYRAAIQARLALGIAVADLEASDVYLAIACARGGVAAVRRFETDHIARVGAWLGAHEKDRAVIDEVRQRVRARALVGRDGAPPRIADYSGRGPLGAWVRVIALREHATWHRDAGVVGGDDDALDTLARTGEFSPELAIMRARYQPLVAAGFRAAIAGLPPRDRTLLRLCYVDGLALEAIGRMYGVNKSTVSRWLAAARASVLDAARAHVRSELHAADADVESLLGLMPRDLELSLHGIL